MPLDNDAGPGLVSASYGKRETSGSKYDLTKKYEDAVVVKGYSEPGVAISVMKNSAGQTVLDDASRAVVQSACGFRLPYWGFAATRGLVRNTINAGVTDLNYRSEHVAREQLTGIRLTFANWRVASQVETATGSATTITASVEYPSGTFTQVTFSGVPSGVIADGGEIESDTVAVNIPEGSTFWVRGHEYNATGVITAFDSTGQKMSGDRLEASSGVADKTMGGTINTSGTQVAGPLAIVQYTSKPSVLLIGDSIFAGINAGPNDTPDNTGSMGAVAKAIGKVFGYSNVSSGGLTVQTLLTSYTKRVGLARYATHVVSNLGTNDLAASRTASQILADLNTFRALFSGKRYYQATIIPRSTSSTSGWIEVADQARTGFTWSEGFSLNSKIRRKQITGLDGVFDIARVLESPLDAAGAASPNSGLWKAAPYSRKVTDAAITSGTNSLTSATAAFTASDTGAGVYVAGAGSAGGKLYGIMTYVNATTVTLTNPLGGATLNAGTTVSAATAYIDHAALTHDGIHPSQAGHLVIEQSGAVDVGLIA